MSADQFRGRVAALAKEFWSEFDFAVDVADETADRESPEWYRRMAYRAIYRSLLRAEEELEELAADDGLRLSQTGKDSPLPTGGEE